MTKRNTGAYVNMLTESKKEGYMNRRNVVRSLQLPQSREEAKYMRQNKNMKRISKAMSLTDNKYQDGKQ